MKRNLARYFSNLVGVDVDSRSEFVNKPYDEQQTSLMDVLNEIFSVDAVSGFPKGDIAYFLSKDGNPQVKAWLESNLLSPRAKLSGTTIEGVTDDVIADFARNDGESAIDYANRLRGYYDAAKAEYERSLNVPKNE